MHEGSYSKLRKFHFQSEQKSSNLMASRRKPKRERKIPINLMDRFRTKPPASKSCKTKASENREPQHVFSSNEFPILPMPSDSLKKLLFEVNNMTQKQPKNRTLFSPHKKNNSFKISSKINGFIAFRSFYSKSISNPADQRKLSRSLANIWLGEENKETWESYSQLYKMSKAYLKNQTFVAWLCQHLRLKFNYSQIYSTNILQTATTSHTRIDRLDNVSRLYAVEDIYL